MNKFKVGDWCEVVGVQDGLVEGVGQVGEVVRVYGNIVTLRFPDRFSDKLHSGRIDDIKRRCWSFEEKNLMPAVFEDFSVDVNFLL